MARNYQVICNTCYCKVKSLEEMHSRINADLHLGPVPVGSICGRSGECECHYARENLQLTLNITKNS